MRELFLDLTKTLEQVCPVFQHVPPESPYPYMTLEPLHSLQGLPWGPTLVTFTLKIWSQYAGTKEILKLAKTVEEMLHTYQVGSLKVMKSGLSLLRDRETRVHTFSIKARIPHE
ncbi:MAG: hypothetical protein HYX35_06135 [Proteobacteria bacterium]|nr:hypothetical protein [Pseudomonadota bacterium]